jgi:hypothetical protein
LSGQLFPYDPDARERLPAWFAELEREGMVRRYKGPDGNTYYDIPNWLKHQKIEKPSPSKIPSFTESSPITPRSLPEESGLDQGSGIRDQGIREQGSPLEPPDGGAGEVVSGEGLFPASSAATKQPAETPPATKPRQRDPLFDALAAVDGSSPAELTRGSARACGVALAEIRRVTPTVTPADVAARAANYRLHMPDCAISPSALSKHWAKCARPPAGKGSYTPPAEDDGSPGY